MTLFLFNFIRQKSEKYKEEDAHFFLYFYKKFSTGLSFYYQEKKPDSKVRDSPFRQMSRNSYFYEKQP